MKIKQILVLLIILVLLTQPVSAGFFGDIFNKITGRVIEEVEEVTPEPEPVPPVESEPEQPTEPESVPPVEPEEPEPVPPTEPLQPEDECLPLKVSQPSCPDGKTPCPSKKDENGCTVWDCDACEMPPEEPRPCPPTVRPVCSDQKTICPHEEDEDGCPVWDCDACEILPEEECPQIPTNQWCYEGHQCPKKMDEKGCIVWDCDSCKKPPKEKCPNIPITMTCGADYCEGKSLSECLCPSKKDENGCTVWDCDSCETIPDNCRKIALENGVEVIECEKECPVIPKGVIKKCEESGGKVIERTDRYGCQFIECEYEVDGDGKCPAPEALEARKKACLNQGLEPMIVRKGECDTIKCRRAEPEQRCAEDVEVKKKITEECMEAGGEVVKHFDNMGCPVTTCTYPEEECPKDVPQEAYKNCDMEEGDLMVKRDSKGCIMFADCVKRGKKEVEYEEIEEMPSAATLLAIALKLESLKIDFDKLATKVRAIAEYYEDRGNKEEAARFRKVAGLFSSALDKIEDIKVKFRENAREMTKEDLRELKYDLNYVSEVIMQDALYIILGGKIEVEGGTDVTREGYTDCGSDNRCWEEALRLCEPVVFSAGITSKIHGLDNEVCIVEMEAQGHFMICKIKNYATLDPKSENKEILKYCEGDMVEWLRSGSEIVEIKKVKPGKCVDRCGDEICQRKVCMAEGCPCQESPRSCPADCGRPLSTEFELCTEEDEKAWQVCQNEGGNPQTDPSKYGNCEIYTHCEIPKSMSTVEDCEKYTDPGIKNDCYIVIAEKTGDSSVCVKITEPNRKDKCYVKAAETSKDESICEKIGAEDIKKHCYNVIAEEYYEEAREIIRRPEVEGEVVFTDNFEEGTKNWIFYGDEGNWSTVVEDGNTFLRLNGVVHATLQREWGNYIFKFRFKRIEGSVHVDFRRTSAWYGQSRYIVAISKGMDNLNKHVGERWQRLDDTHFRFDENWHTLEIRGYNNILNVYMDDELLYKYEDTENPLLSGGVGFEIHTAGLPITPEFLIDDVEIRISSEKDVIGGVP